jgi:hypothetical protein
MKTVLAIVGSAVVVTIVQQLLGIKVTSEVVSPVIANIVNYVVCGLAGAVIIGVSKK